MTGDAERVAADLAEIKDEIDKVAPALIATVEELYPYGRKVLAPFRRDVTALVAMHALLSAGTRGGAGHVAKLSYEIADAMNETGGE